MPPVATGNTVSTTPPDGTRKLETDGAASGGESGSHWFVAGLNVCPSAQVTSGGPMMTTSSRASTVATKLTEADPPALSVAAWVTV